MVRYQAYSSFADSSLCMAASALSFIALIVSSNERLPVRYRLLSDKIILLYSVAAGP